MKVVIEIEVSKSVVAIRGIGFCCLLYLKGATMIEGQIGRVYWGIPYWSFLKAGCLPFVRWVGRE